MRENTSAVEGCCCGDKKKALLTQSNARTDRHKGIYIALGVERDLSIGRGQRWEGTS